MFLQTLYGWDTYQLENLPHSMSSGLTITRLKHMRCAERAEAQRASESRTRRQVPPDDDRDAVVNHGVGREPFAGPKARVLWSLATMPPQNGGVAGTIPPWGGVPIVEEPSGESKAPVGRADRPESGSGVADRIPGTRGLRVVRVPSRDIKSGVTGER